MPADPGNSEVDGEVKLISTKENRAGRISSCAVDVAILQMTI